MQKVSIREPVVSAGRTPMVSEVLGNGPVMTARKRRQIQERHGSQLRIVISPKRSFPEGHSAYANGRVLAPTPGPDTVGGYSTVPWRRRRA